MKHLFALAGDMLKLSAAGFSHSVVDGVAFLDTRHET